MAWDDSSSHGEAMPECQSQTNPPVKIMATALSEFPVFGTYFWIGCNNHCS